MDMQTVLGAIETWPVADRIRLIGEVWDRLIDEGYEPPLTEAQKAELDRRLAAHEADPGAAIPWEVVKAEALARLRR